MQYHICKYLISQSRTVITYTVFHNLEIFFSHYPNDTGISLQSHKNYDNLMKTLKSKFLTCILTVPQILSISPKMAEIREDLPQPTEPTTAMSSPLGISNEML